MREQNLVGKDEKPFRTESNKKTKEVMIAIFFIAAVLCMVYAVAVEMNNGFDGFF